MRIRITMKGMKKEILSLLLYKLPVFQTGQTWCVEFIGNMRLIVSQAFCFLEANKDVFISNDVKTCMHLSSFPEIYLSGIYFDDSIVRIISELDMDIVLEGSFRE